jgi:hypothetical protein
VASGTHFEQSGIGSLSPLQLLGWFAAIVAGSFFFGLLIPGITAMHSGVFYRPSMMIVMEGKYPEVVNGIKEFERDQDRIRKEIAVIDAHIAADPVATAQQASVRQALEVELRKSPPFSIQPFYLHIITYFWPIMYFGLGSAAFILRPPLLRSLRFFQRPWLTLEMAAGIFAFSNLPLLFRTLYANTAEAGRTVFAYPNPDVDRASYIVQQFNFVIFSLLLAVIWVEWAAWAGETRTRMAEESSDDAIDFRQMEQLSKTLLHWQAIFLAISVGFIVYTAIFWDQIIVHGDYRFGFEAIDIHVLWLVTAIVTAVPLALTWRAWQLRRMQIIAKLVNSGAESQTIIAKLGAIRELRPIGFWNMTASGLTVLVSFAAPLIQAFIKKSG